MENSFPPKQFESVKLCARVPYPLLAADLIFLFPMGPAVYETPPGYCHWCHHSVAVGLSPGLGAFLSMARHFFSIRISGPFKEPTYDGRLEIFALAGQSLWTLLAAFDTPTVFPQK